MIEFPKHTLNKCNHETKNIITLCLYRVSFISVCMYRGDS